VISLILLRQLNPISRNRRSEAGRNDNCPTNGRKVSESLYCNPSLTNFTISTINPIENAYLMILSLVLGLLNSSWKER
jgi:hypothetical protein